MLRSLYQGSLYWGSTKRSTKCPVAVVVFFVIYKYYFGSALTSGRARPSDKEGGGGGGGLLDPEIRWEEGGGLKKIVLAPQFGLKIGGGAGSPGPLPMDPVLLTTP